MASLNILPPVKHPNERETKVDLILSTRRSHRNLKYWSTHDVLGVRRGASDNPMRAAIDPTVCYLIKSKSYWEIINYYKPKHFVLYVTERNDLDHVCHGALFISCNNKHGGDR